MNAILGSRIKSFRESKGFTQEQVAAEMKCTRQKYARLEKGLIDISYASLSAIASILDIKVEDITSSVNQQSAMFRSSSTNEATDNFEFIMNMIDTFYAHRKLYNGVKRDEADD